MDKEKDSRTRSAGRSGTGSKSAAKPAEKPGTKPGTRAEPAKGEYGEGNYKASRQYNEATKRFIDSGRVEQAARDAAPDDAKEAGEMRRAEREGRSRAKEEDPALTRGAHLPGAEDAEREAAEAEERDRPRTGRDD